MFELYLNTLAVCTVLEKVSKQGPFKLKKMK